MNKDVKFLVIFVVLFILLIGVFAVFISKQDAKETVISSNLLDSKTIEVVPNNNDWGIIPINGGIVEKTYEVKNVTSKNINLKRIVTSCMCTKASFEVGENKSAYFGMEMSGDKNATINIEVASGQTGMLKVRFDPAAHGPQGVGPFDRVISLTFSDP
ncbi:DUF1573 domain-containing protein, partial [Candidatus Woesebacteria bacterium]|nr:DUF1573 domain-containing protein [Candidatus Woesebacteria bacterium]